MRAPARTLTLLPALAFALAIAAAPDPAAGAEELPVPDGLRTEIDFWKRVFGATGRNTGLVHDNLHVGVVYGEIPLKDLSTRGRRNASRNAVREYREILTRLANDRPADLNAKEQRVLDAWGPDPSRATLTAAAGRLRVQQGMAERFREGLVRSGRWREHILKVLREHGVPEGVAALPHVESSFVPDARSSVGALGMWQFTRSTGRRSCGSTRDGRAPGPMARQHRRGPNSWPTTTACWTAGRWRLPPTTREWARCCGRRGSWAPRTSKRSFGATRDAPSSLPGGTSMSNSSRSWSWRGKRSAGSDRLSWTAH